MARKSFLINGFIAVITVIAIAGAFLSFQKKRSSFERLDFDFHWKAGAMVVDHVAAGGPAERVGIRPGDEILMVAGSPATAVDDVERTLRRAATSPLIVNRDGQTFTANYTAPPLRIDYRYIFLTFIGFLYLSIGLFTYMRGSRAESALFFFLTLLSFVVYVYSPAGVMDTTAITLFMIEEYARIFLPPLTLHFFLQFPQPLVRRRGVIAIYALPAVVALWATDVYLFSNAIAITSTERSIGILDRWEMLHFALFFTFAFAVLTYTFFTSAAAGARKQIKWIYLGMGAGFIPFLVLYLIPFITTGSGSAFTTAAILPLAIVPLAFAVAILKYKLWDVEIVIKEVLAYSVTFVFGVVAFSTINLILTGLIEERLAMERNFLAFASGLLIAGVLIPVKGQIETLLEMVLYRDTYRHRKAMAEFGHELATFHDLAQLLEAMRERLAAAVRVHQVNVYIRDREHLTLFARDEGLPITLLEQELPALHADRPLVLQTPRLPDASDLPMQLVRAGYRYVFPLRHRLQLQGVLLVGNKPGEEPLSGDDLQLVGSITAPVAIAIENARLYGRLRRQLDEIRSLKEYNENLIESSSSAIVAVTADGTVLTANSAFWELIGSEPGESGSIDELFPPIAKLRDANASAMQLQFVTRKGEEKELTVSVGPFNANDAPSGAIVVVVGDITERVRLERELQQKDRLASLGLLAAGVAHEVNTPLTGISSYAQLLLVDTPEDDPRHRILKKMEQHTFRASRIVNNLLDFAANRQRTIERVDLAEIIRSTVAIHEDLMRARNVIVEVGPLEPAMVRGNVHELQQVLTNLLLNARDAVQPGGTMRVALTTDSRNAVMSVADNGKGMSAELQKRIFQPLVTTKEGQGGTGLGLAITDRIVRGCGGEITVVSAPGEGATFSVSLPLWSGDSGSQGVN